jgi:hypothetical protein
MKQSSHRRFCKCFSILGALFILTAPQPIAAQSVERILNRGVKALGGRAALKRAASCLMKGTITRQRDGATGAYQSAIMRPNLYAMSAEIQGFESSWGFNGQSGWRRDSRDGLRTLTGAESADFRTEALYRNSRWLNYKEEKSKVALAGAATVDGKPATAVILTTNHNAKLKIYFDTASGLVVREEIPAGATARIIEYAEYRVVDGLMEPFVIRLSEGDERFSIQINQVVHNQLVEHALFDYPKISGEPLPDIDSLVKQVGDNQNAIDALLEKYTYTLAITAREFNKDGKLKEKETETYEATFYRGRHLRKLIEKDGKPLSEDDLAKENRRLEKRIKEIEKDEAEKEKKAREAPNKGDDKGEEPNEEDRRVTISQVLRASLLSNPRRERFRQRDVIVFDFKPNPNYKPKTDIEKVMQKAAGAVWIDAGDRQVARLEATLVDTLNVGGGMMFSIKSGGGFVIEQDRINKELWLPSYAEFNFAARALMFVGLSINQTIKYGDYKRFNVESEQEKLKAPTP